MSKSIIPDKVTNVGGKIFTVKPVASSEKTVKLHFGTPTKYEVVKLSVENLPCTGADGKSITWINNFGVRDSAGNYVEDVKYTLFLPRRKRGTFVYYALGKLQWDKTPKHRGSKPPRSGMVQVDFTTGDPAAGWT